MAVVSRSLVVAALRRILRLVLGTVVLGSIWQCASMIVGTSLVPTPADTIHTLAVSMNTDVLVAAGQTMWKVLFAIILAVLVGIPLGLCFGVSHTLYDAFRPAVMVVQSVPVISWLSLVIFAWGIGWKGPVFLTFLSLLPVAILTTISGVRSLDKGLMEIAKVYQVPWPRVVRDIYLGSLVPFTIAVVNVSIGQAWKTIVVVEYLCGGSGLGSQILEARMNIDFSRGWALTLIAVILGLTTEVLIKYGLRRACRPWAIV